MFDAPHPYVYPACRILYVRGTYWRARAMVSVAYSDTLPFKSVVETLDQSFRVERLGQETCRSRLHRSRANALNGESRDENERHARPLGAQAGLQFETAHCRHLDICNHTRRVIQLGRLQEFFGRRKWMDDVAERSHETVDRDTNGFIIVDDRDRWKLGQSGLS